MLVLHWLWLVVLWLWYLQVGVAFLAAAFAGVTGKIYLAPVWFAMWVLLITLSYVGDIAGLPVVGYLAWRRAWADGFSPLGKAIKVWAPAWAWPWGNSEDGVVPPPEVNGKPYLPNYGDRLRSFIWCAIRNKVSNLRFTKWLGIQLSPSRIEGVGNYANLYFGSTDSRPVLWSLAWQGIYCGLWIVFKGLQFRIGWTIVPDDAKHAINPLDLRQRFCGFSLQLNRH